MAQLEDVLLPKFKYSNFNLSRQNCFTASPGPGYPVLVERLYNGDRCSLQVYGQMLTAPLLSPFFGRFRQRIAFFFIPDRLYTQPMDQNQYIGLDLDAVAFPYFKPPHDEQDSSTVPGAQAVAAIAPSSLLDMIGIFSGTAFVNPSASSGDMPKTKDKNATPVVGYYDIFRNFYANTQEQSFYIVGRSGEVSSGVFVDNTPQYIKLNLTSSDGKNLDQLINYFVKNPGSAFGTAWYQTFGSNYVRCDPTGLNAFTRQGGLWLCTYASDMLTSWLSQGMYESMVTNTKISTQEGEGFTITQFMMGSHMFNKDIRTLIAGGRYADWSEAQFGVKTDKRLCIPQPLACVTSWIGFDTIVQTGAGAIKEGTITEDYSIIGELYGRGRGSIDSRWINFTTSESGFLMAIYTLVPEVMYSSGVRSYFDELTLGDVYVPEMDRVGYQPLMSSIASFNPVTAATPSGSSPNNYYAWRPDYGFNNQNAIGYQPAWTQLTTALNEVHGRFNRYTGDLSYWVPTRAFIDHVDPVSYDTEFSQYMYPPQTGPSEANFSSYVIPTQFSFPFSVQDPFVENFQIQLVFDFKVKRLKSKSVVPTLS